MKNFYKEIQGEHCGMCKHSGNHTIYGSICSNAHCCDGGKWEIVDKKRCIFCKYYPDDIPMTMASQELKEDTGELCLRGYSLENRRNQNVRWAERCPAFIWNPTITSGKGTLVSKIKEEGENMVIVATEIDVLKDRIRKIKTERQKFIREVFDAVKSDPILTDNCGDELSKEFKEFILSKPNLLPIKDKQIKRIMKGLRFYQGTDKVIKYNPYGSKKCPIVGKSYFDLIDIDGNEWVIYFDILLIIKNACKEFLQMHYNKELVGMAVGLTNKGIVCEGCGVQNPIYGNYCSGCGHKLR